MDFKKIFLSSVIILGISLTYSNFVSAATPTKSKGITSPLDMSLDKDGKPVFVTESESFIGNIPNTINCFDYYKFGSVSADMTASSLNTAAGSNITFKGKIKNGNNYPIVDGSLFVKIFRITTDEKNSNGPDVVDQFIALKDISIPANGEVQSEFTWNVPLYTAEGNYRISTFFQTAKAFNLLGLSFTDDVVGNSFDFKIQSENKGKIVSFNKQNVTINADSYHFASFPPKIQKDKGALVSVEVKNTTSSKQFVNVDWNLYKWDTLKNENLIRTETQTVEVPANGNKRISILISDTEFPVYLLQANLKYKDTTSILNIRYVRSGVDLTRINFPSITSYPLVSGQKTSVFSCLHNSGSSPVVENGKLVLSLVDSSGVEFHHYEYSGKVTGNMMGVIDTFSPTKTYTDFILKSDLYQNGKLVDSATHHYDCKKLGNSCSMQPPESKSFNILIPAILAFLVIIIGLILVVLKHNVRNKPLFGLLLLLTASISFVGYTERVEAAKSTIWPGVSASGVIDNYNVNKTLEFYWDQSGLFGGNNPGIEEINGWAKALENIIASVKYHAEILNNGVLLKDGDTIPVNTELTLNFKKHNPDDINWNRSGFSLDSPFGEWNNPPKPDSITCNPADYLDTAIKKAPQTGGPYTNYVKDYARLIVKPPQKSLILSGSGTLDCGNFTLNQSTGDFSAQCKAVSPGVVKTTFDFSETQGLFYFSYFDYRDYTLFPSRHPPVPKYQQGCYGTYEPLRDIVSQDTYILPVGHKTIDFDFSIIPIVTTNNAPTVTLTGPTVGLTNTPYTFTVTGFDVDAGDKLSYFINWNTDVYGNSTHNLSDAIKISPNENVVSGTPINVSKSWSTKGIHNFEAMVIDSQGKTSGWVAHSINLGVNNPSFDFDLNNDGNKEIYPGQSLNEVISSNLTSGEVKNVPLSVSISGPGSTNTVVGLSANADSFSPKFVVPSDKTSITTRTPQSEHSVNLIISL